MTRWEYREYMAQITIMVGTLATIAVALLTLAAWLFGIVWFLYNVVG